MPEDKEPKTSETKTKTPDELQNEAAQKAGNEIDTPKYPIEHPAWAGPEAAGPTADTDPTRSEPNPEDRSNFANTSEDRNSARSQATEAVESDNKADKKPNTRK